jgi:hypothetical protein
MAATGTLGARLYISATPLTNTAAAADAIGDFQGLTIDTEVGLIENFGELGRQFELAQFQAVADGRTHKLKAGFNDGQIQLTLGQDLSDAGQAALKSYAEASNQNTYPCKITLVGAHADYDTIYFGAVVMSYRTQMGAANAVVKAMVTLEVNTPIFTGAS